MHRLLVCTFLLAALLGLAACQENDGLPEPSSDTYREAVSAFYAGLAGVQTGANRLAEENLIRATELAPEEPAAWANLGVLALREDRLEEAAEHLQKARSLAPENSHVYFLLGLLERRRDNSQAATEHLRQAVELDPEHLKAAYALTQELERQERAEEAQGLLDTLLTGHPDNLALLVERARLAAKYRDASMLQETITRLRGRAGDWPEEAQEQLRALEEAAEAPDFREASTQIAFLNNILQRLPAFRTSLAAVQAPAGEEGELLAHFLRMESPSPRPAPPDTSLQFTANALSIDGGPWDWVRPISLTGDRALTLVVASGETVKLGNGATFPFPGGSSASPPSTNGIAALDYDNDYKVDLALAGAGGVRLFRQVSTDAFTDVTPEMELPADVHDAAYASVWPADLDLEGDLDLVLAAPEGPPVVLQNNGDGTFTHWPLFEEVVGLRDFTWADLDADGDPEAVLLDAEGQPHIFRNDRVGTFQPIEIPEPSTPVRAINAADLNSDSRMELLALQEDGAVRRFSMQENGWEDAPLARWAEVPGSMEDASLIAGDLDNNGSLDFLATTSTEGQIWLSDAEETFQPLGALPAVRLFAAADFGGTGRLDFLGLSEEGQPVHLVNEGAQGYLSKSVQPQAARTMGDQRINSFGIGGTIELRSGLLYQKRSITEPVIHFGLGEHDKVDVARIVWPNGTVQAEFDLETDQALQAQQRLKGSCPWVYTYDGENMRFVTDFLWRTALGLRINAQGEAAVIHSEDRIKIDGDALAPSDGFYDVRITGELWETHFFDHVALMAVDHPEDTEVFVDGRFTVPPSAPPLRTLGPLQPVERAHDHEGRDVTDLVRTLDERYFDTFDLGPYQGIAEEHFVEIDLGDDVLTDGPLWLVASGWVYPTDSSINLAIDQGDHPAPRSLQLEVPNGEGGWTVVDDELGFPAGKTKTMLIDLSNAFEPGTPRRVRLRTNMEIYWDRLAWAEGRPDAETETYRLDAETADLRYRGFSEVRQESRRAPELPVYDRIAATTPIWRDLEGYHTRFGDVRELIQKTDDRYVIMNAGDELVFRFSELSPPPEGWTRDFVLIGDGWVKDGDYNTGYSTTVLPLPYHGQTDYSEAPGQLEDDPAYRQHPEDWETYHTRYVTPERFHRALAPESWADSEEE